jgi:hypothetical protein
MRKRILGFVPAALICAAILCAVPVAPVFTADAPWADDAVTALNEVYGSDDSDPFTADDAPVTTEAAIALLNVLKPNVSIPADVAAYVAGDENKNGCVVDGVLHALNGGYMTLDANGNFDGSRATHSCGIIEPRGDGRISCSRTAGNRQVEDDRLRHGGE